MTDGINFGIAKPIIARIASLVMAMTYFKWLGITPKGFF